MTMVRLEGDGIVIRPLQAADLDLMVEGRRRLGMEISPAGPPNREELRGRIERSGEFHEGRIDLGIEADGRLIGDIQTYRPGDRDLPPAVYEIGVALYDRGDRGKGLGTEAVRLFVDWLFQHGGRRVQAGTTAANPPMRRVFEKLGFRVLGDLEVEGISMLLYGVTRSEWRERRGRF